MDARAYRCHRYTPTSVPQDYTGLWHIGRELGRSETDQRRGECVPLDARSRKRKVRQRAKPR